MTKSLIIKGAREHNLQGVDVSIPRGALTVITGVSGSGKSSLAFDTIFQEGQRKFVESLSAYARQFIGAMGRPLVDEIRGITPTISIDQKTVNRNTRSTVGTSTEISDHLRLLFARLGEPHCPQCLAPIKALSLDQVAERLMADWPERWIWVLAPLIRERKGEYRKELEDLLGQGFFKVRIDGQLVQLDEQIPLLARYEKHTIEVFCDRIELSPRNLNRLREALEKAKHFAKDVISFWVEDREYHFSLGTQMACPQGHGSLPELEPRLFSFNDPQGQCPDCKGLGRLYQFIEELVIDPSLSVSQGAIRPMMAEGHLMFSDYGLQELEILAQHYGFDLGVPWSAMSAEARHIVLWGSPDELDFNLRRGRRVVSETRRIRGVLEVLQRIYDQWRPPMMKKYLLESPCQSCHGARLNPGALAVRFNRLNIDQISHMTVAEAFAFFEPFPRSERELRIGGEIFREIQGRLRYLQEVGLSYLSLDRSAASLSGGESQRIRLASQVGAGLRGVTYVLDEPSIGLHPRDNQRLLASLERLRSMGNTLVVVEHDEETMLHADYLVDIGPGAGVLGGQVLASGRPDQVLANPLSTTAAYLNGQRKIELPPERRGIGDRWIRILGARENNLKNIDVGFPLGVFVAVTGVSGSGKSTLVHEILGKALSAHFDGAMDTPGAHTTILGLEYLDKAIVIDQDPIGRTPRSNPVTYTKVFDEIRNLFAALPESKLRGYSKSRFSFNVPGGRCEDCQGSGYREVEMQLLPNVQVPCEACNTKRFNPATLEVHYKGRTIADILELSIDEALELFAAHPKICKGLKTLQEIGLGYIKLGQPSTTLSGGEAQRMKMAQELQRKTKAGTLYLLDEPTTGLHFEDIRKLVDCLQELVRRGNTVMVIEHNLDVIKCADWIVDMGPEGGAGGGNLVAEGTPEQIIQSPHSLTGQFLKPLLDPHYCPAQHFVQAPERLAYDDEWIRVKGARKHNLRNIDVDIPHGKIVAITGPSGAGKTSLALDTLFSEGQRRFVESLSTYARRFLGQPDRGQAESIEGLCPAIAIDQKSANRSPRSTVATMTELYDHFRLLWARVGIPHAPLSGELLQSWTLLQMCQFAQNLASSVLVLAPLAILGANKEFLLRSPEQLSTLSQQMLALGYQRLLAIHRGQALLYTMEEVSKLKKWDDLYLVADRTSTSERSRLLESIERALEQGHGVVGFSAPDSSLVSLLSLLPSSASERYFLETELEPKHFSFNSHWGACRTCQGIGSLAKGSCLECGGERLRKPYSMVKIGGHSIAQVTRMTVAECGSFFDQLQLDGSANLIAQPVLREIQGRLDFLQRVGLSYLNLDRTGDTLSGGEAQRIRLAGQIGSGLEGVLYVLDEPTTGLHQRDTERLFTSLVRLRDLGNTILVVEHDLELIAQCDWILDLGPGAGILGGELCAQGILSHVKTQDCPTAPYLRKGLPLPVLDVQLGSPDLDLELASKHNLQEGGLHLFMGAVNALSGVSGSGKSTLALECLVPLLQSHLAGKKSRLTDKGRLVVKGEIEGMVVVDQSPISGTPRSTPVSYTKLLDKLRDLFAALPESKLRGFSKSRFSYNMSEGRCPVCEGRGAIYLEMHFLSDVWEPCESCHGRRYNAQTLEVKFKNKSIADILDMNFDEAVLFFDGFKVFQPVLQAFVDLGLGYLKLGQPVTTMSGGESQRLKLATELGKKTKSRTLYVLDEPTTGLHPIDIEKLWTCLHRLCENGHGVLLVEHHPDLLRASNWLTDLGPEGGGGGGRVLYQGPPNGLMGRQTPTALALWGKQ